MCACVGVCCACVECVSCVLMCQLLCQRCDGVVVWYRVSGVAWCVCVVCGVVWCVVWCGVLCCVV